MSQIINIASIACLVLLILGFFLGFFRSVKKSLTRFVLIALCLLVSIVVAPILSDFLIKNFVKGYVFEGFGFSFDFKETVEGIISSGGDALSDIMNAQATETLVVNIVNIMINIVAFFAIFFVLIILTLIFFWIGSIIVKINNRKKPNYEQIKANSKKLSSRLCGGLFGVFSSVVLCFVLLVPVFGIMNICDAFLDTTDGEAASAIEVNHVVAGQLFYKDNESIGVVEGYIEQYAEIKKVIDDSTIAKVSNSLGLSNLGKKTFEYLTTSKQGGIEVSLTNEVISVINIYNIYKENFVENSFNGGDKESLNNALDAIEEIYNEANNSAIVKSYLIELVPRFREKWVAGEKYLGIEFPITGEYQDLVLLIIDKGFDTYSLVEINNNVYSLINIVRIVNNSGLIDALKNEKDIMDIIKEDNQDTIKQIIVELSNSKFENALPIVIEDMIKIAYDAVINTEDILTKEEINDIFSNVDSALPDVINWEEEGESLQNLIKSSLEIMDVFYSSKTSTDTIIKNLDKLGLVIDSARTSVFSNHFKILVDKMINTKIDSDILGKDAMSVLSAKLDANWSKAEFKFADMFNILKQTALLAQKLTVNSDNVETDSLEKIVENLETVVGDIISNPQVKDTFVTILEKDVIEKFIPDEYSETIVVVKDMVNSFMLNTSKETLKTDIAAGKEIINIVNTSVNNGTFSLEDEKLSKKQKAEQIIEKLTNSSAIMSVVETAVNEENVTNTLKDMAQTISGEDVEILKTAISDYSVERDDEEEQAKLEANKEALMKLFGINA